MVPHNVIIITLATKHMCVCLQKNWEATYIDGSNEQLAGFKLYKKENDQCTLPKTFLVTKL